MTNQNSTNELRPLVHYRDATAPLDCLYGCYPAMKAARLNPSTRCDTNDCLVSKEGRASFFALAVASSCPHFPSPRQLLIRADRVPQC
jgi:hypothetical protein